VAELKDMTNWQQVLAAVVGNVEKQFEALKSRLDTRLGSADPIKIIPYYGYGSRQKLYLKGRVLQDEGTRPAGDNDSLWRNLVNMYRRLESDEVPGARVLARFADVTQEVVTDEEGFFAVWLEPPRPLPGGRLWHPVELVLLSPLAPGQLQARATGEVFVPPPGAQFMVISDIDDTVVQSHATQLLRMARTVFLGNARTRLPFPGVAAFYRALHAGRLGTTLNPLFYVSSSPWNLYDLFVEFFQLQGIPLGPIFLRDWGVSEQEILPTQHRGHKLHLICQMLDFYDHLPFILIGDSGQEDPEIYHEIVGRYPHRILAVYIRNVSQELARPAAIGRLAEEVAAAGSTLILADNTLAIAQHAAEQGWIAPEALAGIQFEKEKDEAPPDPLETLLGEAERTETPTVVIESQGSASPETVVKA
jgi:phosphatidate phosphatase APP1